VKILPRTEVRGTDSDLKSFGLTDSLGWPEVVAAK